MRSFTNKKGEVVTVSKEHLDTAVEIKIQLQKASPSRRCSWATHVKMMKKEGFDEAENSERYRCMIKSYQNSIGKLPSAENHADMVADNKLESIKEMIGEISYAKRDAQNEFRKLNKVKRDMTDQSILVDEILDNFSNYNFSDINFDYKPIANPSGSKMIVTLSDLHIGAIVEDEKNNFNFKIAQERLQKYIDKIILECELRNIDEVYVINLGDVVEHATMRFNHGYEIEFDYGEQIVKASDIIVSFLSGLAKANLLVTYSGIAGNHDRLDGNKNNNVFGNHAVKPINGFIKSFIGNSDIENLKFDKPKEDYKHSFVINGKKILALHGDLDNINDDNLLSKHTILDDTIYDIILMGHYHTIQVKELTKNKYLFASGSLKGADNYSVNSLRKASSPSQSFYIVDKEGNVDVNWITFD